MNSKEKAELKKDLEELEEIRQRIKENSKGEKPKLKIIDNFGGIIEEG